MEVTDGGSAKAGVVVRERQTETARGRAGRPWRLGPGSGSSPCLRQVRPQARKVCELLWVAVTWLLRGRDSRPRPSSNALTQGPDSCQLLLWRPSPRPSGGCASPPPLPRSSLVASGEGRLHRHRFGL